nr:unnamed protein product [Digitaria exilis]
MAVPERRGPEQASAAEAGGGGAGGFSWREVDREEIPAALVIPCLCLSVVSARFGGIANEHGSGQETVKASRSAVAQLAAGN